MTLGKSIKSTLLIVLLLLVQNNRLLAQDQQYPSLLWEITGNGLSKPSYLFGTMHVSDKIAFRLGSPFFEALEKVDVIAMELEPELWFDEVLKGDALTGAFDFDKSFGFEYENYGSRGWNKYYGTFELDKNLDANIQGIFKSNPSTLNRLLFRFDEMNANFEESTWLDMYIYQSAKKLKKQTYGLETFEESMSMQVKSTQDKESNTKNSDYKKLSYSDRMEVHLKIEDAYRRGDLDQLDSLTKLVSEPSFLKYILIERNKNFMVGIDTLIKQRPTFVAVGAAHLPGKEGCIEMLRDLGYTVKPVSMGKKDGKQKKFLEELFIKRPLKNYTSPDGVVSFDTPYNTYPLSYSKNGTSYVTMDITNGLTFTVDRMLIHSQISGISSSDIAATFEKFMYETIPGEILSSKKLSKNGFTGFEVINKTRRGDVQKNQIYFTGNEVIVARLSASGEKVKQGAGDYFFANFNIDYSRNKVNNTGLSDESLSMKMPGNPVCYTLNPEGEMHGEIYLESIDADKDLFAIYRISGIDRGFIDEDVYELKKLEDAFRNDLKLKIVDTALVRTDKSLAFKAKYEPLNGKSVHAYFKMIGLTYYTVYAITNNSEKADNFFNSITFDQPKYKEYFPITDSTLYFKSKIPWEKEKSDFSNLYSMLMGSFYKSKKKINLADDYTRSLSYTPPTSLEKINVYYKRYGKYEMETDKKEYLKDRITYFSDEGDLIIKDSSTSWSGNDYKMELWLADTASNRGYHYVELLNKRSRHTIKTTFDYTYGESEYQQTFINNFEPLEDTLNTYSYFDNTKEFYLQDVMSSDSVLFESAQSKFKKIPSIYEPQDRLEIYKFIVDNKPAMATKDEIKDFEFRMNYYLYLDDSKENMDKLVKSYYTYPDSAEYLQIVLENLLRMKTKESFKVAKNLLLNDPPIGTDADPFDLADRVVDSLELGVTMFPEILELTSYDEYENSWVQALATLMDSGMVKKEIYQDYVSYFLREAKVELKRFSSSSKADDTKNTSKSNKFINYSYDYWCLLYPYRNSKPDIKQFFETVKNSKKQYILEEYAYFLKNHNEKIDDEFCKTLLKSDKPIDNYLLFKDLDKLHLLPDTLNVEKCLVEDDIKNGKFSYLYGTTEIDSIVFIQSYEQPIRNRTYTVYQYKYQKTSKDKSTWYIAVAMIKKGAIDKDEFKYISKYKEYIESDPIEEQFEEIMKYLIDANRDNKYGKSSSSSHNYDNSYNFLNY